MLSLQGMAMLVIASLQVLVIGLSAWTLKTVHEISVKMENHEQRITTAEWWNEYYRSQFVELEERRERELDRARRGMAQ